jgi:hypothetical protein
MHGNMMTLLLLDNSDNIDSLCYTLIVVRLQTSIQCTSTASAN